MRPQWSELTPKADGEDGLRYLKVYAYNVENPEAVINGAKPNVTEIGPFVYAYGWKRYNFNWSDDKDVIHYNQWQYYKFDRARSVGWDNQTFTTANFAFWGITNKGPVR